MSHFSMLFVLQWQWQQWPPFDRSVMHYCLDTWKEIFLFLVCWLILWSYPTECWYPSSLGIIYNLFCKVSWAAKIIQWAISFTWSWMLPAKFDVESFCKTCIGHDRKHKNSDVPDRDWMPAKKSAPNNMLSTSHNTDKLFNIFTAMRLKCWK
jgi:hypothetical protein